MLSLNVRSLVILGVYTYLMCCVIKKGNIQQKGIATVIAGFLLLTTYEGMGHNNNKNKNNKANMNKNKNNKANMNKNKNSNKNNMNKNKNNKNSNSIKQYQKNSTIQNNQIQGVEESSVAVDAMPYDGIVFQPNGCWMKQPDNVDLVSDKKLTSYLGSQGPVKMRYSDQNALSGPPVDGVKGSPEKMFMFANNRAAPECCPSSYSASTGCVCTTKNQRDFIASRGYLLP